MVISYIFPLGIVFPEEPKHKKKKPKSITAIYNLTKLFSAVTIPTELSACFHDKNHTGP